MSFSRSQQITIGGEMSSALPPRRDSSSPIILVKPVLLSPEIISVGEYFLHVRKYFGWSQTGLCCYLNISVSWLKYLEKGTLALSEKNLAELQRVQLVFSDLFGIYFLQKKSLSTPK